MTTRKPRSTLKSDIRNEKEVLGRLSAGLSEEEIQRVLAGALSTLGREGLDSLAAKLGPDTGPALRRALQSSSKNASPLPGPAKVIQDWKQAWADWDRVIGEACDEDGKYVLQEHHWEEPCFDPLSVTGDLEPIAARMSVLLPRVWDENLDSDFSFAEAVVESMDEIASSLPDWMPPFDCEGFCLGPEATACLIEWEQRTWGREGKETFGLIDKLRELEAANSGLALDERVVAAFVRGLGREAKGNILKGIRAHQGEDSWKKVLNSAHSGWFNIYKDLCRGQDRSGYLETCRARISQDWSLALPVAKELVRKKANEELFQVCAEAATSFLSLRDGKTWDPRESLLVPRGNGPTRENPDERLIFLLGAWKQAAVALGREDTGAAIQLQLDLLANWKNWDKALAAFSRIPPPGFDAMRDKLFDQWRLLVTERSVDRFDFDRDQFSLWEKPRTDRSWVRALADAACQGEAGAVGFQESIRLWLKEMEADRNSPRRGLNAVARLSLDLEGGDWLRTLSPALAGILGCGWTIDKALLDSRRKWLSRLGGAALVPELQVFWKRNVIRFIPDPVCSDYERCVDWLRALWEIDPDAGKRLLGQWGAIHWRRRNLWRAVRGKGLPVPDLHGRKK